MKGIVFNLLEEAVSNAYGEAAWDRLLDVAGLQGAYTSLGSYDDAEIATLVRTASQALEIPEDTVLRWFGRRAMPLLARRYPAFFDSHANVRSFLLSLNSIIHPEVRKLYPGAHPPVFDFDTSVAGVLKIGYNSPRRLCALADGFMHGAATHFGERIEFEQDECMHRGDARCVFHVRFDQQ
ncbi:heme NO-binding protein [Massilia sp. Root335]|nr:heme NO-binding protein [Massilia sp. Root335]